MDRKRLVLLGVLLTLVALVILDNSDPDWFENWTTSSDPLPPTSPQSTAERLAALHRAIKSGSSINEAYGELAGRYADRAADLDTLLLAQADPKAAALDLVGRYLRSYPRLEVERVSAVVSAAVDEVVFPVEIALDLVTPSHSAALAVIYAFARPDRGLVWEEFDLRADDQEQLIEIKGKVRLLIVKAVE